MKKIIKNIDKEIIRMLLSIIYLACTIPVIYFLYHVFNVNPNNDIAFFIVFFFNYIYLSYFLIDHLF